MSFVIEENLLDSRCLKLCVLRDSKGSTGTLCPFDVPTNFISCVNESTPVTPLVPLPPADGRPINSLPSESRRVPDVNDAQRFPGLVKCAVSVRIPQKSEISGLLRQPDSG